MSKLIFFISLVLLNSAISTNYIPDFLKETPQLPKATVNQDDKLNPLFHGIIQGMEIFKGLQHEGTCDSSFLFPLIAEEFELIYVAIFEMYRIEKVPELAKVILENAISIWRKLNDEVEGDCGKYIHELEEVLEQTIREAYTESYVAEFAIHTLTNLEQIKKLYADFNEKFEDHHHAEESGLALGTLIHFTFIWGAH
jgi:hypothetical protein